MPPLGVVLHDDTTRTAGWSWTGLDHAGLNQGALDGVPIDAAPPPRPDDTPTAHPNLIDRIDHLVVATPDVGRTIDRYEAAGLDLRRTRTLGDGSDRRTQAFFWAGEVILELVGPETPASDGPSALWGISFASPDLDDTIAVLGPERIGPPRDAVQPGRRIATIRTRDLGISLPLAVMTPHSARRRPNTG